MKYTIRQQTFARNETLNEALEEGVQGEGTVYLSIEVPLTFEKVEADGDILYAAYNELLNMTYIYTEEGTFEKEGNWKEEGIARWYDNRF